VTVVKVPLDAVPLDGSTQVRVTLSGAAVEAFAQVLKDGGALPPIVLFRDADGVLYLGDGNHRALAALRLHLAEIDAEIRDGGKADAIWYALGAAANGLKMSGADKKHAVRLALINCPHKSGAEIGRQVGCSHQWVSDIKTEMRQELQATCSLPDVVVGKNGRQYPAVRQGPDTTHPLTSKVLTMLKAGTSATAIAADLKVSSRTIAKVRKDAGLESLDRSPAAVQERRERMRALAGEGYTSRQIAGLVGLSDPGCRAWLRDNHIDVPADRVVGKTKRHDPNRIVDSMVTDAANLTEGVELVDFAGLDRERIPDWLRSLHASREMLSGLIRRLMKERQHEHDDKDAYPHAV